MKNKIEEIKLKSVKEGHLGGYIAGGDKRAYFPKLWKWIVKDLKVHSVLDVGCGEGHALRYFKRLGCNIFGVDGSPTAIRNNVVPQDVVEYDFCKGTYTSKKKYDLVWSCEFVEHIEPRYLYNFLKAFESSNKYIFMTHARPGESGWHHVNCRSDNYWIEIFSRIGFKFDPKLTKISRELAQKGYFVRSGLVFVKDTLHINPKQVTKSYIKKIHTKMKFIDQIKFGPIQICKKITKGISLLHKEIDKNIGKAGKLLRRHSPSLYSFLKGLNNKKEIMELYYFPNFISSIYPLIFAFIGSSNSKMYEIQGNL